jgi:hypothetical protein
LTETQTMNIEKALGSVVTRTATLTDRYENTGYFVFVEDLSKRSIGKLFDQNECKEIQTHVQ